MFQANTRVSVLRGAPAETALGDEVDDNSAGAIVAAYADIPAALTERSRNVFDPASGTRRTVRIITCRIAPVVAHPTTGVRTPVVLEDGDRIKDRRTARVYAINETVTVPRSLAGMSSLTLDLRDTAAVTPTPA